MVNYTKKQLKVKYKRRDWDNKTLFYGLQVEYDPSFNENDFASSYYIIIMMIYNRKEINS